MSLERDRKAINRFRLGALGLSLASCGLLLPVIVPTWIMVELLFLYHTRQSS